MSKIKNPIQKNVVVTQTQTEEEIIEEQMINEFTSERLHQV